MVQPFDDRSIPTFLQHAREYVRQASPAGMLELFDEDDQRRCVAVDDCFARGRGDARALIMLRRVLPSLRAESLSRTIWLLSHATNHPDILWTERNWIPRAIEEQVRASLRWSTSEVYSLVAAVEIRTKAGEPGWERGGLGQCLWHVLAPDPNLRRQAREALALALDDGELDTAHRLLVIAQYLADNSAQEVDELLLRHPDLLSHELTAWLIEEVQRAGELPVY